MKHIAWAGDSDPATAALSRREQAFLLEVTQAAGFLVPQLPQAAPGEAPVTVALMHLELVFKVI